MSEPSAGQDVEDNGGFAIQASPLMPAFSYEGSSTVPLTHTPRLSFDPSRAGDRESEVVEQDVGFFARLEPISPSAKLGFHKVASICLKDPNCYHAQFLHVNRPQAEAPVAQGADDDDSEDAFEDREATPQPPQLLSGYYRLSLAVLPDIPPVGWRVGKGRPGHLHLGVDLLLTTPDTEGTDLAGIHGRLSWVPRAGGFFLIAYNARGKEVVMNGDIFALDKRIIPYQNMISLGDFVYRLVYEQRTPAGEEQFQVELNQFFKIVHRKESPLVLPTPSGRERTIGDYIVRHAIAKGSFGVVSVVTHLRTGEPIALKEIMRTKRNTAVVEREIAVAELLKTVRHVGTSCQSRLLEHYVNLGSLVF